MANQMEPGLIAPKNHSDNEYEGRSVGGPQVEGSKGTPVLILGAALRVCTCVLVCCVYLCFCQTEGFVPRPPVSSRFPPAITRAASQTGLVIPLKILHGQYLLNITVQITLKGTGHALCNVHEVCARQAKAIIVSDNVQFSVDSAFVENI